MSDTAHIYRAVILRAVLGPGAHAAKAVDLHRLNQIAEHLAACEEAQTILWAKGHGGPNTTIVEAARQVPSSAGRVIRALFFAPAVSQEPGIEGAHDPRKVTR